jgi:alpha-glucoside transport system permease protein
MTMTTAPLELTPETIPTVTVPPGPTRGFLKRFRLGRNVLNIVMALIAALWLLPSFSMLVISFRQAGLFEQSGWWNVFVHISQLTLTNYKHLFSGGSRVDGAVGHGAGGALDSVRTSLEITVPATLLVVIVSAMAAYSLVFGRWKGRNTVFLTCVGLMVVPLQVAILPVVQGFHSLGNLTGWNPYGTIRRALSSSTSPSGLPFGIFLMRNFYLGIPKDLIEAGRVDGAGEFTLFRRVVVPIGVAAAASLAIFQFIWTWNDLLGGPRHPGRRPPRAHHPVHLRPGTDLGR